MNINNIYDLEHFDEFNNIFTIYKKHVVTYKRNDNNEKELLSDYYKYIPIYGHYYNNNNHFICKRIIKHQISNDDYPSKFLILKNEELARPYKGGIYIAKDIDDLYDIIERLTKYKQQNEES